MQIDITAEEYSSGRWSIIVGAWVLHPKGRRYKIMIWNGSGNPTVNSSYLDALHTIAELNRINEG